MLIANCLLSDKDKDKGKIEKSKSSIDKSRIDADFSHHHIAHLPYVSPLPTSLSHDDEQTLLSKLQIKLSIDPSFKPTISNKNDFYKRPALIRSTTTHERDRLHIRQTLRAHNTQTLSQIFTFDDLTNPSYLSPFNPDSKDVRGSVLISSLPKTDMNKEANKFRKIIKHVTPDYQHAIITLLHECHSCCMLWVLRHSIILISPFPPVVYLLCSLFGSQLF